MEQAMKYQKLMTKQKVTEMLIKNEIHQNLCKPLIISILIFFACHYPYTKKYFSDKFIILEV